MVCFCKQSLSSLPLEQLAAGEQPGPAQPSGQTGGPQTGTAPLQPADAPPGTPMSAAQQQLAGWMAGHGLPAAPWQPDPAWQEIPLPTLSLSASALATLSAFAQLRVDALALGIDVLAPGQGTALIRLAATVAARLQSVAAQPGMAGFNPATWTQLSSDLTAADQVQQAQRLGLLPTFPQGAPLAPWRPFLFRLRALLPLIALSSQLGIGLDAHFVARLAAALRVMRQIPMPALTLPPLASSLTAGLSAVARLGEALGVDPLAAGAPAVRQMVQERVAAAEAAVAQSCGGATVAEVVQALPQRDYCPTLMAPPAVVQAAVALTAPEVNLASLNWQVPSVAQLPVLSVGLPAVAFATQLKAALGVSMAASPCGGQCDAAALQAAALAA
jgi:hypothetical protein